MGFGAKSVTAIAACLDPRHDSLKFLSEPLRLVIHEHVRSLVDDINEESSICTDTKNPNHLQKSLPWP